MILVDMPVEFVVHPTVKYFCSQIPFFIHHNWTIPCAALYLMVHSFSHVSYCALHVSYRALHVSYRALHVSLHVSHFALHVSCLKLCISCLMSHTVHFMSRVSCSELHVTYLILCTSCHPIVHFHVFHSYSAFSNEPL